MTPFVTIVRIQVRADNSNEAAEIIEDLLGRLERTGDLDGYSLLGRPFTPSEDAILD